MGAAKQILLVEDDSDIRQCLVEVLESEGYKTDAFESAENAIINFNKKSRDNYDLIISDIRLTQGSGLDFTAKVREINKDVPVILMTAFSDVDTVIQGMRLGVFDYLKKPFDPDVLLGCMRRALQSVKNKYNELTAPTSTTPKPHTTLIGTSSKMEELREMIKQVAPTGANVLITGESGTGKEVVARLIHEHSHRRAMPFVAVNCSAIPENLLESELFGHVKGSFTGALQNRKGLFQEAEGGTIFLDEIGDMPLSLQVKLLRVLQEKKVRHVGDNVSKPVDIRIIAATNKDLGVAIENELFREDLYYRLSVVTIDVSPLRERREDITPLAEFFLRRFAPQYSAGDKKLSPDAMKKLVEYSWPGNVRQLENLIERSLIFSKTNQIESGDIDFPGTNQESQFDFKNSNEPPPLKEIEKQYISHVLKLAGGKKEKAARLLQIDRKTLYRKAIEYGIKENDTPNRLS